MTLHHILVRDFTTKQKADVAKAADDAGTSTSRFCRDAAVEKATGKPADAGYKNPNGRAPAKKAARKKGRP